MLSRRVGGTRNRQAMGLRSSNEPMRLDHPMQPRGTRIIWRQALPPPEEQCYCLESCGCLEPVFEYQTPFGK